MDNDNNIFAAIWERLEAEGHDARTIARVCDMTCRFMVNTVPHTKDALLDAPHNPWTEVIDAALGEPLRKLTALGRQIREDIAVVGCTGNLVTLAHVDAQLDQAVETLDGQQDQLDALASEIRKGSGGGAKRRVIGPPPIYEQMEAAKAERRQRFRALW